MTRETGHLVVVGMGQLNALWAQGALKRGMVVTPVVRRTPRPWSLAHVPLPSPLLIGVGEDGLAALWPDIPQERRAHVVFMQNELFPSTWEGLGVTEPSVMVVWLNRKQDSVPRPGPPTQLFGPHAATLATLHEALGLAYTILPDGNALRGALTAKYGFILTLNALGHHTDRPLGAWCAADRATVDALLEDALRLGARLSGLTQVPDAARTLALQALELHHALPTRGRTAGQRVERAWNWARQHGVEMPALRKLFPQG
jgi:hypothetical protein